VYFKPKHVKTHVTCISEQNVTSYRTWDKGTMDKFNNTPMY